MNADREAKRAELRARFPGAEEWITKLRGVFGPDCKFTYLENKQTGDRVGKTIEERGMVAVQASVVEKPNKDAEREREVERAKARPKRKVQARYVE